MAKNITALKNLYKQLGGSETDVAPMTKTVEVLNAITVLLGGEGKDTKISDAIDSIAAVADKVNGGEE